MRFVLAVLLMGVTACATASSKEVQSAQAARYKADKQLVLQVVNEEIDREYRGVAYSDPLKGLVVGPWRWYDRGGQLKSFQGGEHLAAPAAETRTGDAVFRLAVSVTETPEGLRIIVDGYAQLYEHGTPVAVRIEHGDMREPWWVRGKIDAMQVKIHERLAKVPGVTVVAAKDPTQPATVDMPPAADQVAPPDQHP